MIDSPPQASVRGASLSGHVLQACTPPECFEVRGHSVTVPCAATAGIPTHGTLRDGPLEEPRGPGLRT